MKTLSMVVYLAMLATTPSLVACPQVTISYMPLHSIGRDYKRQTDEWIRPKTYDEITQMLESLESGELEQVYSPANLERINEFLAALAKGGMLSDELSDQATLENDVEDLVHGDDSAFS